MRISKCNGCGKILDSKLDSYYSISEISKHIPDTMTSRLVISKNGNNEMDNVNQITESWVSYCDLDFCEVCWEKESLKNYTK